MKKQLNSSLLWALCLINLVSGVLFALSGLNITTGGENFDFRYLAISAINLIASGVWYLGIQARRQEQRH